VTIARLLSRRCTITRRSDSGTVNDYGDAVATETTVETLCELQQQRRTEPDQQGELSDTMWLLVLPAGTQVDTGDVVTVDGQAFELVGDPWPVRRPLTGRGSHVEATLRRTS
jgi:hypothetical protein